MKSETPPSSLLISEINNDIGCVDDFEVGNDLVFIKDS